MLQILCRAPGKCARSLRSWRLNPLAYPMLKKKGTDFPDRILVGFSAQTYFQVLQSQVFMILDEHELKSEL